MITAENALWVPGDELRVPEDYIINPEILRDTFASAVAHEDAEVVSIDEESLSALILPDTTPTGFLFIDIDDFIGDLSASLQALQYGEPTPTQERQNNHDYGEGMFFSDEETLTKQALIALLKNSEHGMLPVPEIEAVRDYILGFQAAGVYVTFLTAATPASELATVSNFLGKHFNNACDGVVITSGDYRVADKGTAAASVINFINGNVETPVADGAPVIAMDDWPRHTKKIRDAVSELPQGYNVTTLQYTFPSSQAPDTGSEQINSVLGCFDRAYAVFRESLTKESAEQLVA